MGQQINPVLKQQLLSTTFRAAIIMWNRLEGRARKEDFDRSLRAEVRDPLWMLTRQWQFGEFRGEDSGSAVKARVQLNTTRIDRYAVKSENREATGGEQFKPAVPYDNSFPLETEVEREQIWETNFDSKSSYLELRSRMGRHWMRLLKQAGLGTAEVKTAILERFGFDDIAETPNPSETQQVEIAYLQSDVKAWQTLLAIKGRLPDGYKLLRAIETGDFSSWVDSRFSGTTPQLLKDIGQDYRSWFYRLYSQPPASPEDPNREKIEDAWAPSYLEYQFAVSAPEDESEQQRATLVAEQYHQGHLDWFAFDVDQSAELTGLPDEIFPQDSFEQHEPVAFLPSQIEFTGMPNVRFWEFEDRRTDFGSIRAGTADVPLLLLAEFGLIYGNDWTVIPYNLEVGTLADIKGIIVTDVFGIQTLIRPAGAGQGMSWQKWSMYKMRSIGAGDQFDRRLFLPPTVAKIQESNPIEKVTFARDEMTNIVWGVEEKVPGILGTGVDGFEAATALSNYFLQPESEPEPLPHSNNAKIQYVLGTSVPENWIPFIARHKPGSNRQIRLQRAALPRLSDSIPNSRVEPRSKILRTGLDVTGAKQAYFVHPEEVPRAGAIVTRSFQRARWFDGRVFTWIGRRKQSGRGEGMSGVVFDQISPLES